VRVLHGVEHGLDRRRAEVGLIGGGSLVVTAGELGVKGDVGVSGGGVERGSRLVDNVEQHDEDVGGEAGLVADLGGAEDVDGGEVKVALL
jgi:hypothetical protein